MFGYIFASHQLAQTALQEMQAREGVKDPRLRIQNLVVNVSEQRSSLACCGAPSSAALTLSCPPAAQKTLDSMLEMLRHSVDRTVVFYADEFGTILQGLDRWVGQVGWWVVQCRS